MAAAKVYGKLFNYSRNGADPENVMRVVMEYRFLASNESGKTPALPVKFTNNKATETRLREALAAYLTSLPTVGIFTEEDVMGCSV